MSEHRPERPGPTLVAADEIEHPPLSFSVVIPTLGHGPGLERCIKAVLAQSYPLFEVTVVDNGDNTSVAKEIADRMDVGYTREPRVGLSCARNRGALMSRGDIVAYIDDDAVPEHDWLKGMLGEFSDPKVMAVAGRTIPLALETEAEKLSVLVRRSAHDRPMRLDVDGHNPSWFAISAFGGVGGGGNMAIRRAAFDFWGGFDERLGRGTPMYGGEEQYAFFALVSKGFRVTYTPAAVVRHPVPPTMDELRRRYLLDLTASAAYFTFLLAEEPEFRGQTLRYLLEGLKGTQRPWRGAPPNKLKVVSGPRKLAAFIQGPIKYFIGRRRRPLARFSPP